MTHKGGRNTQFSVRRSDSQSGDMSVPITAHTLALAKNIAYRPAVKATRHSAVLGPAGKVVRVE